MMNISRKLFGNAETIRKQQIEIVSTLNRWYQVKEDLIFAFEKTAESEIGEPSKTLINEFIIRVNGGLDIDIALKMLSDSYEDISFKYFLKQIAFNMKYKGNTGELLDILETQMIKVEEEYTRRKISTGRDRRIISVIFGMCPLLGVITMLFYPSASYFYFHTKAGFLTLLITGLLYFAGLILFQFVKRGANNG